MADGAGFERDGDLVPAGGADGDRLDFERRVEGAADGGFDLSHGSLPVDIPCPIFGRQTG